MGRLGSVGAVDYTYDGFDRVADRDGVGFVYQGSASDPVTDGTFTYSRTPGGGQVAVTDGTDDRLAGLDRHGDLTHLYTADGTVTDTALYDPFGDPLAATGSFDAHVGRQPRRRQGSSPVHPPTPRGKTRAHSLKVD